MSMSAVSLQRYLKRENIKLISRFLRVACVFATLLLFTCLAWAIMRYVVEIATEAKSLENEIQALSLKTNSEQRPANTGTDYSVIYQKSLFGALTTPTAAPTAKPTPKPNNSKFNLMGVVLTDGQEPYAIIEDSKKSQQDAFSLNEMVFGEAKLIKIGVDRVDILRGGQKETLIIDDSPASSSKGTGSGISADGQTITLAENEIDKALENLPLLLTQARAVPYFKDGKAVGLRMFAIKTDSLYEKIGIKNADILKTVNGNNLGDLSQAMKLFEQLKTERALTLVLERNGEEKEYKYEIR